jgi:hypothetical protein
MQLKIFSDGTVRGTTVRNAETGDLLENIASISWSVEKGRPLARATIELVNVPVNIKLDEEHVRKINIPILK